MLSYLNWKNKMFSTVRNGDKAMKRMLITAALAVLGTLAVLTGCSNSQAGNGQAKQAGEQKRLTNVAVEVLHPSDLEEYLELSGATEARRDIMISSEQGGTVQQLLADRGDRVSQGQILARINADIYEAALAEAEANMRLKDAALKKAAALYERKSITQMQRLQAQVEYDVAAAGVKTAQSRLNRAIVRAPFGGVIDDRFADPGEMVAPGGQIFHLVDCSSLKIKSEFSEQDVVTFRPGLSAEVRFDAFPDSVFRAQLSYVAANAHTASRTFPCEFILDNPDGRVRGGMYARVRVLKTLHRNVLVLPQSALVETEEGRSVFVMEGETARRQPVKLGASNSGMVVIDQGLSPEETVVVTGNRELVDGQQVKVTGRKD